MESDMVMQEEARSLVAGALLDAINEQRGTAGLGKVEAEPAAARMAEMHARDMAENSFASHFGRDGSKPYQRYFAGGLPDHVAEAVGSMSGVDLIRDFSDEALQSFTGGALEALMSQGTQEESAPSALLAPMATHAGVGVWGFNGEFRVVAAMVTRLMESEQPLQLELPASGKLVFEAKLQDPHRDLSPAGVIVYKDPPPLPLEAADLAQKSCGSYEDFGAEMVAQMLPSATTLGEDGTVRAEAWIDAESTGCSYYSKLFLAPKAAVKAALQAEEEGAEVSMPLPDSVVGQIAVTVVGSMGESLADSNVAESETLEQTTSNGRMYNAEEQRARSTAHQKSPQGDKAPFVQLQVVADSGSVSPPDGFEQQLFVSPDRLFETSSMSLSVCGHRIAEEMSSSPVVDVDFLCVKDVHDEEAIPEGWERSSENILEMICSSGDDAAAAVEVFMIVQRAESNQEAKPIVDIAVVYGSTDFDMGAGYITKAMPEEISYALGHGDDEVVYFCIRREGAAPMPHSATTRQESQTAATHVNIRENEESATLGPEVDVEETGLSEEELQAREDARNEELREAAEQQRRQREEEAVQERRRNLTELVEQLQEEKGGLLRTNGDLQRKIVELMLSRKRRETAAANNAKAIAGNTTNDPENTNTTETSKVSMQENEKAYAESLASIMSLKVKSKRTQKEKEGHMLELQTRLDDKESRVKDIYDSFTAFTKEIFAGAENSRTGKDIPKSVILRFEAEEKAKDKEMEQVRLKNINFRMRLKKVEATLRTKEQLAEGLHLIDFEQLKIENQTINEKIEDRNEELNKLRKKNTHTVQILTHLKEKLQFVQARNRVQAEKLQKLDGFLTQERDKLGRSKREREKLRKDNARLRQQEGFANSNLLVQDYEQRHQRLEAMKRQVNESQRQYRLLQQSIHDSEKRIEGLNAQRAGQSSQTPLLPWLKPEPETFQ